MKAVILGVVLALAFGLGPARAVEGGPCQGRWRTQHDVAKGIRCVWIRFDVGYGGVEKALDVARCESGLNPKDDSGTYEGLFQHSSHEWAHRYDKWVRDHPTRRAWRLPNDVFDGRTNAIVTALMVRRTGWSSWSCA